MNTQPHIITHPSPRRLAHEVFGPAPADSDHRRLLQTRSAIAYLGLFATLAQVVVWLAIAVITGNLDSPWWLWTAVPAALAVAGLTGVLRWRQWYSAQSGGRGASANGATR